MRQATGLFTHVAPSPNPAGRFWHRVLDGHPGGRALYERHYSSYNYRDGRQPKLFVGPGEKVVLLTSDGRALFVWRKFRDASGQTGINCAVFRNEAPHLFRSSDLVRDADAIAFAKWPGERHYTYVNPKSIRHKRDPGRCFLRAGWKNIGITKGGLHILALEAADA